MGRRHQPFRTVRAAVLGRRQIFELPEHRTALLNERRAARNLKGRDRIRAVVPTFDRIVERWDVAGSSLGLPWSFKTLEGFDWDD